MATPSKQDLIAAAKVEAARAGIDQAHVPLFLGLIESESNWNPRAVSSVGARGLGQLMPNTAKGLGVSDSFDPVENLRGAATYFSQQLRRFGGDASLALTAYNWGPGNAAKLQTRPSSVRVPKETQDYVPRVFERSLNYGGQVAPTNFAATLFPKLAGVTQAAVDKTVGQRFASQPDQIERAIQTGSVPKAASPAGAETLIGEEDITRAGLPPMAASPTDRPAQRVATMDEFLKKSYGPLAEVADPFPRGFDQELLRIIDEA